MLDRPFRALVPAASLAAIFVLGGCGGAAQGGAACPPAGSAEPAAAASAEPESGPAPFEGTFELQRGTDGKATVDFVKMIHSNAIDGQILWAFEGGHFTLGVWILGSYKADGDPDGEMFSLCRGRVTVSARYEGKTLVLPSELDVKGYSDAARVEKKRDAAAGKTTTRTMTKNVDCSAQIATKRITFEVVEKDAEGPVRLKASVDGGYFELQRTGAIDQLDAKALVKEASQR
jgi:hypothetical protein